MGSRDRDAVLAMVEAVLAKPVDRIVGLVLGRIELRRDR